MPRSKSKLLRKEIIFLDNASQFATFLSKAEKKSGTLAAVF